MAKKSKGKVTLQIKGLSTKKILTMDVYKLNAPTLRVVLNRLISSANKRIKRLKSKAPHSPAIRNREEDFKFSLKGVGKDDRNQMESLMKDVKNFLTSETSTMKGFKGYRGRVERTLGTFDSVEQENEFWNTFNDWIKNHPNITERFNDSFQIRSMMYDEFIVKERSASVSKANVTKAINRMLKETKQNIAKSDALKRRDLKNAINNVFDNKPSF